MFFCCTIFIVFLLTHIFILYIAHTRYMPGAMEENVNKVSSHRIYFYLLCILTFRIDKVMIKRKKTQKKKCIWYSFKTALPNVSFISICMCVNDPILRFFLCSSNARGQLYIWNYTSPIFDTICKTYHPKRRFLFASRDSLVVVSVAPWIEGVRSGDSLLS